MDHVFQPYQLNKSSLQLDPPSEIVPEGVQLKPSDKPLQSSFIQLFVGAPGSGKTHLLKQYIQKLYFFKFNLVLIVSSSMITDLELEDQDDYRNKIDMKWIVERINGLKKQMQEIDFECMPANILIVFDDVIGNIKRLANQSDPDFLALFFNRRQFLKDKCGKIRGTISLIVTTQKYILFPWQFRPSLTATILFGRNIGEYEAVRKNYLYQTKWKKFDAIVDCIYNNKSEKELSVKEKHTFLMFYQNGDIFINFDRIVL